MDFWKEVVYYQLFINILEPLVQNGRGLRLFEESLPGKRQKLKIVG